MDYKSHISIYIGGFEKVVKIIELLAYEKTIFTLLLR